MTVAASDLVGLTLIPTAFSGTGTVATCTVVNSFTAGQSVCISGTTPAGYSGTFVLVSATATNFTYLNTTTGAGTVFGTVVGFPTDSNQLWALAYLFTADWSKGMKLHSAFMTDVTKALSDIEQRRAMMLAPARIIEADLLIRGSDAIGYFRSFLMRAGNARFLLPLWCDEMRVTGVSTVAGNSVLSVDGTVLDRRYFVGGRVAVVGFNATRSLVTSLTVAVIGATGSTITAVGTPFDTSMIGYSVYPLIEAELLLEHTASILCGNVLQLTLSCSESRGVFSLDTLAAIGSNPGAVSFNSYPVLVLEPDADANNLGMQRSGEVATSGRGKVTQIYGPRGRFTYVFHYLQLSRLKSANLIRWFEAMAGRLHAFYVLSPTNDFIAISFTSMTAVVQSFLLAIDWTWFPAIGVKMPDGSYQFQIVSTGTPPVQSGANWTLTFDTPWTTTPDPATIQRLSAAHLMRFDVDEMVEEWTTDGVMASSLKLVELTSEVNVTIANIKDFSGGYH